MKKYLMIVTLIYIAMGSLSVDAFALFKSTKFTIVVVNEEDEPLSGIRVGVGFEKNTGWGTDSSGRQGVTDADGKLTFSGQSNGHITYGGRKDGYYPGYYDYDFRDLGVFGWEPWNPELKIVMRKVENPVPMYARYVGMERKVEIPELNKEIGFDLIASDWVAPYGKGATADFVFYFERDSLNPKDYISELRITFSKKNDGIIKIEQNLDQGSVFKFLRFAPKAGYFGALVQFSEKRPGSWFKDTFKSNDNYVFRVRSEVGDSEKIERALYGKIIGPIQFFPARSKNNTILQFKYYLNPDGTRNLEFDPGRNLFGKLPMLEQVSDP